MCLPRETGQKPPFHPIVRTHTIICMSKLSRVSRAQTQVVSSDSDPGSSSVMLPNELLELFREEDFNDPASSNEIVEVVWGSRDDAGEEEIADELYGEEGEVL